MTARDWGLAAAALGLALDQGSKLFLLYGLHFIDPHHPPISILPFFNLVMVWNPGVSYGLFPAHSLFGTVTLVILAAVGVTALGWWLWQSSRPLTAVGLGLVIGGALGNLIDRIVYQRVADFFHFYVRGYDWYVFNVADCAITVGVVALLYDALLRPEPVAAGANGNEHGRRM